ncbi:MAG: hypothetical protein SCALA701_10440 [Candidatus Scalindua sp.]|nr:MAG: hypothetical protein SCALA701_10440 [Candidatus Scalindua sp.]
MEQQSADIDKTVVRENETATRQPVSQGSGYLSDGSTVSVGLLDGDEELKIFEKVRKMEKSLESEKEMRETLEQNLTDVTVAKENLEDELAVVKKDLEECNINFREEIKVLVAKIEELEGKLAVAEIRPKELEEKLIKAQIAETKATQELFKLKIDLLEKGEE